jgi:NADH-quinone oxidoreductase subunit D
LSTLDLNVGPQHPGSGHMRIMVKTDGDIIVEARPDIGYVHRGVEKIAESRNIIKNIPMLCRPNIADDSHLNWSYIKPIEELQRIEVPERGLYIRTMLCEINRIASHLYGMAIMGGVFSGHTTMYMFGFGDRELLLDLHEMLTGARMTFSFFVPGGVRRDLPKGFKEKLIKTLDYIEGHLPAINRIFVSNPILIERGRGVGVLRREDAIKLGVVGPVLRGSGVRCDVRKDAPYGAYDKVDFDVPTFKEGDSLARWLVRFEEMKQSISILRQLLRDMPGGPIARKSPIVVPRGEAVGRIESARGEINHYIIGDGGDKPYRVKMSTGSFKNLTALPFLLKGARIGDLPIIYGSLDYWPVEADR